MQPINYILTTTRYIIILVSIIGIPFLVGCQGTGDIFQNETEGGSTPEEVVEYFLTNLNETLQSPDIELRENRQIWAVRLSNYFTPAERDYQRVVIGTMLATFARGLENLAENQRLVVEIVYTELVADESETNQTHVHIIDGELHLRWMRVDPGGAEVVQRDLRVPLTDMLGEYGKTFPVMQVNGRWFLTEALDV